ncbi:D-alanyl-D-alanine carboxypeptidase family protein, partial [Pseudomonadota bacterium]
PASITKIMTVYTALKEIGNRRLDYDGSALISKKAWKMGGSRMFVEAGEKVSVEKLLKGIIIQNANDASVALAEHIAGSENAFVKLMNQYAARLGMKNTHFKNSTGFPDAEHLTTARDIATLSRALIKEFPGSYADFKEKEFAYNNIKQYNRNKLLWRDENVDGLKSGHTESSGYSLVTSSKHKDLRLISVVFGTKSEQARADISQKLLDQGFRYFESRGGGVM